MSITNHRPPRPIAVLYQVALGLAVWISAPSRAESENPDAAGGRILVEICEQGVSREREWPATPPAATERYEIDAFGISAIPHAYTGTGVRADRASPFLLRASAEVELPAGSHRLLLRGRGATRLTIDGRPILDTPFPPPITDGHTPIPTEFLDLGPDLRFAPPGNRERWTTFESDGGPHAVVLETIVGGATGSGLLRPEPGETVVAISPKGTDSFQLLAQGRSIPYTDPGWAIYAEAEAAEIARIEARRRADAFRPHAAAWEQRRRVADRWLGSTPEVEVPEAPGGVAEGNAIDRFLAVELADAAELAGGPSGGIDFDRQIRPILEGRCYSCHRGEKVRGGLRLDTAEGPLDGGASGFPAVVPGDPDASELLARLEGEEGVDLMPPQGGPLPGDEVDLLRRWIEQGASRSASRAAITPPADDLAFLRRVTLDTVGLIPTEEEIGRFLDDDLAGRRERVVDRLLDDPRHTDRWVGYWQDVLAENPNILNPTLNNTGPFRWWIEEALRDGKPIDLFVTELIGMEGSLHLGGPAGFAMASENDAPMADKAVIVASAFLGVKLSCARCHDAPAHESTQEQVFQLAAMLGEGPIEVPPTSSVPLDALHERGRPPLIEVTLAPGTVVEPAWPFPDLAPLDSSTIPAGADAAPRALLAATITAPGNERFAQVIANRVWARLMGRGLVEPVDDWEKAERTHPELLRHLGRELVRGGFDVKHLERLILNSNAYQRAADPGLDATDPLYAAPAPRRLDAEQVVDSLFLAAGKAMDTEEINLDVDGGRATSVSLNLGRPRRAWQFASTSNERDRPSLSLPRVQAVVDVLEAFGWRSSRPDPLTVRETAANPIQPAILANGPVGTWLTRLSDDHGVTRLALEDQPVETLVDRLFLRILTRLPEPDERSTVVEYLDDRYDDRIRQVGPDRPSRRGPPRYVSWSNHLTEEANEIKVVSEAEARRGDPPTDRLDPDWRRRLEDVVWSLLNAPEFVFRP